MAAAVAVAIFALDPNVLYLQSTPMTEPLLFGLVLLSVFLLSAAGTAGPPVKCQSIRSATLIVFRVASLSSSLVLLCTGVQGPPPPGSCSCQCMGGVGALHFTIYRP